MDAANSELCEKGISAELCQSLQSHKEDILEEEAMARKNRDECEKELKIAKTTFEAALQNEKTVRGKRGRKEKSIRQMILPMFENCNTQMSSYHGGDMEGPSIRRLMQKGTDVFGDIATEIIAEKNNFESASMIAPDNKIELACQDHGTLCVLLDKVFSLSHTKKGEVTVHFENISMEFERNLFE